MCYITLWFLKSVPGQMYVFFPTEKTIKKSHLITYCQQMQEENIDKAIFVAQETLTPVAKRVSCIVIIIIIRVHFWKLNKKSQN